MDLQASSMRAMGRNTRMDVAYDSHTTQVCRDAHRQAERSMTKLNTNSVSWSLC